jgi:hypothetical protein
VLELLEVRVRPPRQAADYPDHASSLKPSIGLPPHLSR